jgi:hypothetical protein
MAQLIAHWRRAHPREADGTIAGVIESVDDMDLGDGAYWGVLESYGIDADDVRKAAERG